jgi:hypothetical protein
MSTWGFEAGLKPEDIIAAVSSHLFKRTGGPRGPLLRFAVDQGPNTRDPIMIRVAHDRTE